MQYCFVKVQAWLRLNCALLTILFPQKLKPKAQENGTEKLSRGNNNDGRVSGRNQSLRRWSIEREREGGDES